MRTLLILLLGLVSSAYAADGSGVLRQLDANMWPESYEMYRKLINVDKDGSHREYVMYSVKKGRDKVANFFLAPPEDFGRVMLRVGDSLWLRLPDVLHPWRISSMQSVVGGIFNNWDLMRSSFSSDYQVEAFDEEPGLYVLSLKAQTKWAVYDKLKLWVDKKLLLPQKIEALTASDLLIKTLRFKNIKDFGDGIIRPSIVETESPLQPGVKAVTLFGEIRKREFSDEVFSVNYMAKIGDLRR